MNLPTILLKLALLATLVFWIIIGSKSVVFNALPFIVLSFIPIFLVSSIVVIITVGPFFWLASNEKFSNKQVFKTYYPYYAIVAFILSLVSIISFNYSIYSIAFYTSAFITTSQSWVWFSREK